MNSCQKGKRGERAWRDQLREAGYKTARRGRQFSGSPESPDVVCDDLPFAHWEVKWVENLNIMKAMEQARRDAGGDLTKPHKYPFVAHRRNNTGWMVTMDAATFFQLLREGQDTLTKRHGGIAITQEIVDAPQDNGLDES